MDRIKEYKSRRWERFRKSILKRDGYLCKYYSRFGESRPAEMVHHIYPTDEYPELFYNPYNLISLSFKAHELMHDRMTGKLTIQGKRLQEKFRKKIFEFQENKINPPL